MSTPAEGEKTPLAPTENRQQGQGCFFRHITMISRFTGIAVLALMWAATVTTLQGNVDTPTYVGYYLLAASILVTFLEATWMVDKMACCVREGCCCRCWSIILWVDGWRKFIIYSALSVPLFIQGIKGILDIVTGFCLLVLAVLYLIKSFVRTKRDERAAAEGRQALPGEVNPVAVATQESATQSDVTSVALDLSNVGTQTTQHPRNPFDDAEGVDLDEAEDADGTLSSDDVAAAAAAKADERGDGGGGEDVASGEKK